MTKNGVSTGMAAGEERYEKFHTGTGRKRRTFYQYDFRSHGGELYSCVKPTLKACRKERDRWLRHKEMRDNGPDS